MTPAERRLRAIARNKRSWAATPDRAARTAPARLGLENKFLREARELHPDANLTPAQLDQIAKDLRAAFYADLALKSVQARRRRGGAKIEQAHGRAVEFPLLMMTPGGKMVSLTVKARYDAATDTFELPGDTA